MAMTSLSPGVLYRTPGLNRSSTPIGLQDNPSEISTKLSRGTFDDDNSHRNWPPDSPPAGCYDIGNTSTKLVLLNNRCSKRANKLRGHSDTSSARSSPDRGRQSTDGSTDSRNSRTMKNPSRHVMCLDSSSPRYEPEHRLGQMWRNQSRRPPWTPDDGLSVNKDHHYSCQVPSDPSYHSLEYRERKLRRRARAAPPSMKRTDHLNHPDLSVGQRRYLWHIAQVYSVNDAKAIKQKQYLDLLNQQANYGFLSPREYVKYRKYLESPQQRPYGVTEPLLPKRRENFKDKKKTKTKQKSVPPQQATETEKDTKRHGSPHASKTDVKTLKQGDTEDNTEPRGRDQEKVSDERNQMDDKTSENDKTPKEPDNNKDREDTEREVQKEDSSRKGMKRNSGVAKESGKKGTTSAESEKEERAKDNKKLKENELQSKPKRAGKKTQPEPKPKSSGGKRAKPAKRTTKEPPEDNKLETGAPFVSKSGAQKALQEPEEKEHQDEKEETEDRDMRRLSFGSSIASIESDHMERPKTSRLSADDRVDSLSSVDTLRGPEGTVRPRSRFGRRTSPYQQSNLQRNLEEQPKAAEPSPPVQDSDDELRTPADPVTVEVEEHEAPAAQPEEQLPAAGDVGDKVETPTAVEGGDPDRETNSTNDVEEETKDASKPVGKEMPNQEGIVETDGEQKEDREREYIFQDDDPNGNDEGDSSGGETEDEDEKSAPEQSNRETEESKQPDVNGNEIDDPNGNESDGSDKEDEETPRTETQFDSTNKENTKDDADRKDAVGEKEDTKGNEDGEHVMGEKTNKEESKDNKDEKDEGIKESEPNLTQKEEREEPNTDADKVEEITEVDPIQTNLEETEDVAYTADEDKLGAILNGNVTEHESSSKGTSSDEIPREKTETKSIEDNTAVIGDDTQQEHDNTATEHHLTDSNTDATEHQLSHSITDSTDHHLNNSETDVNEHQLTDSQQDVNEHELSDSKIDVTGHQLSDSKTDITEHLLTDSKTDVNEHQLTDSKTDVNEHQLTDSKTDVDEHQLTDSKTDINEHQLTDSKTDVNEHQLTDSKTDVDEHQLTDSKTDVNEHQLTDSKTDVNEHQLTDSKTDVNEHQLTDSKTDVDEHQLTDSKTDVNEHQLTDSKTDVNEHQLTDSKTDVNEHQLTDSKTDVNEHQLTDSKTDVNEHQLTDSKTDVDEHQLTDSKTDADVTESPDESRDNMIGEPEAADTAAGQIEEEINERTSSGPSAGLSSEIETGEDAQQENDMTTPEHKVTDSIKETDAVESTGGDREVPVTAVDGAQEATEEQINNKREETTEFDAVAISSSEAETTVTGGEGDKIEEQLSDKGVVNRETHIQASEESVHQEVNSPDRDVQMTEGQVKSKNTEEISSLSLEPIQNTDHISQDEEPTSEKPSSEQRDSDTSEDRANKQEPLVLPSDMGQGDSGVSEESSAHQAATKQSEMNGAEQTLARPEANSEYPTQEPLSVSNIGAPNVGEPYSDISKAGENHSTMTHDQQNETKKANNLSTEISEGETVREEVPPPLEGPADQEVNPSKARLEDNLPAAVPVESNHKNSNLDGPEIPQQESEPDVKDIASPTQDKSEEVAQAAEAAKSEIDDRTLTVFFRGAKEENGAYGETDVSKMADQPSVTGNDIPNSESSGLTAADEEMVPSGVDQQEKKVHFQEA